MAFNSGMFQPLPPSGISVGRPQMVNKAGNLYRIPVMHASEDGQAAKKYEIWATKEAVQGHFPGVEAPSQYHLTEFARTLYQKNLQESGGQPLKKGIFVSTTQRVHGDPKLFPHMINDPEAHWV